MKLISSTYALIMVLGTTMAFAKGPSDVSLLNRSIQIKPLGIKNVNAAEVASKVKGYKDWKKEKLTAISDRIAALKIEAEKRRMAAGTNFNPSINQGLEKQIELLQNSLETTQDLTVTDYFVGYLNKQDDRQNALKEAAEKMSSEEIYELMKVYSDTVNTNQ